MTLNELMLIKRALLPYEFVAYSREEWHDMKVKAHQLIIREINLKTMNPVLSKEVNDTRLNSAIQDAEMKMYGE